MMNDNEKFSKIAEALLVDYTSVYYVDAKTNEYCWYSIDPTFHSLQIEQGGADFFQNMARDAEKVVYEEDKHIFQVEIQKENLLKRLRNGNMQSIVYRLMMEGKPVYHALRLIREVEAENDYFVLGVLNIDKEVRMQQNTEKLERERQVFNQIAESLASKYDVIYYVDVQNGQYSEFKYNEIYGNLEIQETGNDFFVDSQKNASILVHPKDEERVKKQLTKDSLIASLAERKQYSTDYRLMINGKPQYTRMTVMWAGDRVHFLIGVDDISDEIAKEKEQLNALNSANEKARRDELTGVKNKNAYQELEVELQKEIAEEDEALLFGLVVCDLNNLKRINDTLGHKAGDEYISSFSQLISDIYTHSPVFRIGGDEFVVFLRDRDYRNRDELYERLRGQILENLDNTEGPVAATGMSIFYAKTDKKVSDVFDRADSMMYADKRRLKERSGKKDLMNGKAPEKNPIPAARKGRLDALFDAFLVVAEGSYVYLCDMRYDYSRWCRPAVDTFALPSEYMYGAGDIWEKKIHPEDRETYHVGIDAVFSGNANGHDMQYRALRADGGYDICTCRGLVIRDQHGEPEYFGGVIRNHGLQGHIDTLTGLRNQYGFFEDLKKNMIQNNPMRLCMLGPGRFSEINEIYGYQFGNRVLQKFGRILFEHIGNSGSVYRLDGTRFAILTNTLSIRESHGNYEELRAFWRKGINIDDLPVILEMNAGLLSVDQFNIDEKTVYSCLNFAYVESKMRKQGDLVEFYNDLNEENRNRIEKLHAIRAAITHGFRGFYLLYQPVVDAQQDEMTGAEALLRWKNDTYGVVPPDLFISILESDPLFPELGKWILKTALTDAKTLLEKHPSFMLNVNLSYTQLEKPDFLEMVFETIQNVGYPPENLCLEITERCRLLNLGLLKNIVDNLRGRGVKIALDDFGTGFSSIGLLKDIPFDVIKIDRSFVQHIEQDDREKALINQLAQVASVFGAKICVEGIETQGMRDVLKKYNIQSFQGYYYDKPMEIGSIVSRDS